MWIKRLIEFLWNHFWKLLSLSLTTGFVIFVNMVQSPAQVEARITTLEKASAVSISDREQLKISQGASNVLYNKIDQKLDRMNESIIILSEQVKQINSRR